MREVGNGGAQKRGQAFAGGGPAFGMHFALPSEEHGEEQSEPDRGSSVLQRDLREHECSGGDRPDERSLADGGQRLQDGLQLPVRVLRGLGGTAPHPDRARLPQAVVPSSLAVYDSVQDHDRLLRGGQIAVAIQTRSQICFRQPASHVGHHAGSPSQKPLNVLASFAQVFRADLPRPSHSQPHRPTLLTTPTLQSHPPP